MCKCTGVGPQLNFYWLYFSRGYCIDKRLLFRNILFLQVCLLLGVEIHESVTFEDLIEPCEEDGVKTGWRARLTPHDHEASHYEFDFLICADGKRNTIKGFARNEFRGKLAIGITANFINRQTQEENKVPEISGVTFIFNQKFFRDMQAATAIDLENIVYYKDDTHYFVMTAKKQSLIERGVILTDQSDVASLLRPDNVNRSALLDYASDAARFATKVYTCDKKNQSRIIFNSH